MAVAELHDMHVRSGPRSSGHGAGEDSIYRGKQEGWKGGGRHDILEEEKEEGERITAGRGSSELLPSAPRVLFGTSYDDAGARAAR